MNKSPRCNMRLNEISGPSGSSDWCSRKTRPAKCHHSEISGKHNVKTGENPPPPPNKRTMKNAWEIKRRINMKNSLRMTGF